MKASGIVDYRSSNPHNMYGCLPCPKCTDHHRAPYRRNGKLVVECDNCPHKEPGHIKGDPRLCEMLDVSPGPDGMGEELACGNEATSSNDDTWCCDHHAAQLRAEGFNVVPLPSEEVD